MGPHRIAGQIKLYRPDEFKIEHLADATGYEDGLMMERLCILQHETMWPRGYNHSLPGRFIIQRDGANASAETP